MHPGVLLQRTHHLTAGITCLDFTIFLILSILFYSFYFFSILFYFLPDFLFSDCFSALFPDYSQLTLKILALKGAKSTTALASFPLYSSWNT